MCSSKPSKYTIMKKLFTLFVLSFLAVSLYAFDGTSKLSITSATRSNLRVMIDGNKYQRNNNNSVVFVNNLEQGFHSIKIFKEKNIRWGRNNNSYNNSFNRFELVYSNRIYIKPQYFVDIVINRFGKAFIDEQMMQGRYSQDEGDDWDDTGNNVGNNDSDNFGNNDMMPMSDESFAQFKMNLRNEGFDDTRVTVAKQVIAENAFTSKQVKEILQQFNFEASKVDIAKFAYEYTIDKGSYFLVNDAFSYSSSKQELSEYIQSVKH